MYRGRFFAAVVAASLCFGASSIGASASPSATPLPERAPGARGLGIETRGPLTLARGLDAPATGRHGLARTGAPGSPAVLAVPVPSMTIHDATGDAVSPHGDLTGVGMLQNASGTTFGVTLKSPANPTTDPSWRSGAAFVGWSLDTNGNGLYEYLVVMGFGTVSGRVIAAVTDSTGSTLICPATPIFVAGVGYRVVAPAGCLPHLTTARFASCMFYSPDPSATNPPGDCAPNSQLGPPTAVQQKLHDGYWMLGSDGHVYSFGGAVGLAGLAPGAVAMAPRHDGAGYWVVDSSGSVFAYGTARFFGGRPALGAGESVRTISATPNGGGYWLFTNNGRAFPFGNAKAFGDMTGVPLNGPIVASVATSSGKGYYMVGSDGGIFSFGDARFHGSTGNIHLNKPVVGMSPTPDGKGYWLVASDGGVFAFAAPFRGSMGGTKLNRPVDGLVAFGNGYLMAASDGGIFDFSNKAFYGSLAGQPLAAPIVGLAAFSS
ncbi:MAG: hypothetical protein QOE62_2398 [Actinomycetota bacterium]|nr:hypothetical protein [Actinomycetota bacterium]